MRYTVIGLGQFGQELCKELRSRDMEVVAVGANDDELAGVSDIVEHCGCVDYSNPKSLESLELDAESVVIVAIGDSLEQSLFVITTLQKMGIKRVYARVINPIHESILKQMNVPRVINLASVVSRQLASQLESPRFIRVTPIDQNHSIAEILVPRSWIGHSLRDAGLRTDYNLNLLTVRRGRMEQETNDRDILSIPKIPVIGTPSPDLVFAQGDILVLFGEERNLIKFGKLAESLDAAPSMSS